MGLISCLEQLPSQIRGRRDHIKPDNSRAMAVSYLYHLDCSIDESLYRINSDTTGMHPMEAFHFSGAFS
jgi:hypothetical protein